MTNPANALDWLERQRKTLELKPCPFCGGEAWTVMNGTTVDGRLVYSEYKVMHNCRLFGTISSRCYRTKTDAVNAWNKGAEPMEVDE